MNVHLLCAPEVTHMKDSGFTRLLGRNVDVIELTAEDGATDEEMTALAEVLDELEAEQTASGIVGRLRLAGHTL
jgi:hypothetical protein